MAITIDVLPAGRGDCLWVECDRPGRPWRLLVDGGLPQTWPALRERIARLKPADRVFDLAVVSHIDLDHIGGMLPLLTDTRLGIVFGDVWFNGLPQLPQPQSQRERGVAEGESLVEVLSGAGGVAAPPWNAAFDGFAVSTGDDAAFREVDGPGWPRITLLSPTRRRLAALRKVWVDALTRLQRGEPDEPLPPKVPLAPLNDLEALAATTTARDRSATNGSSIAFLLEHRGASCLLTADASPTVLGAALTSLANVRGGRPIEVGAFQLPHHGSKGNVTAKLLALAPARHYVVSTNGDDYGHPHDETLARAVTTARPRSTLWFNYTNDANERWRDAARRHPWQHTTRYPDPGTAGVRLELSPARPG